MLQTENIKINFAAFVVQRFDSAAVSMCLPSVAARKLFIHYSESRSVSVTTRKKQNKAFSWEGLG